MTDPWENCIMRDPEDSSKYCRNPVARVVNFPMLGVQVGICSLHLGELVLKLDGPDISGLLFGTGTQKSTALGKQIQEMATGK